MQVLQILFGFGEGVLGSHHVLLLPLGLLLQTLNLIPALVGFVGLRAESGVSLGQACLWHQRPEPCCILLLPFSPLSWASKTATHLLRERGLRMQHALQTLRPLSAKRVSLIMFSVGQLTLQSNPSFP